MNATAERFDIEAHGECVILTPRGSLFEASSDEGKADCLDVLNYLDDVPVNKVVVDFGQTSDCDSSGLGFCMSLWKQLRRRNGAMALCNVSAHELATLRITKLDRLWPICSSRAEALAAVGCACLPAAGD